MNLVIDALTTLSLAGLFGGFTAFSLMFAPLVFIKLPAETAGGFIRQVFPWYYLYILIFSLIAAALLWSRAHALAGSVVLAVGLTAVYTRWGLMPEINRLRDKELAGDPDAGVKFNARHRFSVMINAVQWIAVTAVLLYWAAPPLAQTIPPSA